LTFSLNAGARPARLGFTANVTNLTPGSAHPSGAQPAGSSLDEPARGLLG